MTASATLFSQLFAGRTDAYGRGEGYIVRAPVTPLLYAKHLAGHGSGIGIFPLADDDSVAFSAIDLDEPNFGLARDLQMFLPGRTWVERSRTGNAHIWAFFKDDIQAWIPRAIMRHALESLGRKNVEVFPKQDALKVGMVGNYINLPYHGAERPFLIDGNPKQPWQAEKAIAFAFDSRLDSADWRNRAASLKLSPPEAREDSAEFGEQAQVHPCAQYIYANRESNPIREGTRSAVIFNLSKMLLNWRALSISDALEMVMEVNAAAAVPHDEREAQRIFNTAVTGQYTSTGCDDPLMAEYVRPDCPIANA